MNQDTPATPDAPEPGNLPVDTCRRPACHGVFPRHTHYNGIRKVYCSKGCRRTHYNEISKAARLTARSESDGLVQG